MTIRAGAPVVVGVDGSQSSLDAVTLAAAEAALRGRSLRIVHAYAWPPVGVGLAPETAPAALDACRGQAEEIVRAAGEVAGKTAPDVATTTQIRRGPAGLVALHAWDGNSGTELNDDLPMTPESWSAEDEEKRVLAEALAGVADRYPDVRIRRCVLRGSPRRLLVDHSLTAQLVVVGDRGHGVFTGPLLGSVSQYLIHRASCPIAVVRPGMVAAVTG